MPIECARALKTFEQGLIQVKYDSGYHFWAQEFFNFSVLTKIVGDENFNFPRVNPLSAHPRKWSNTLILFECLTILWGSRLKG